jgi:hypothetical protein
VNRNTAGTFAADAEAVALPSSEGALLEGAVTGAVGADSVGSSAPRPQADRIKAAAVTDRQSFLIRSP